MGDAAEEVEVVEDKTDHEETPKEKGLKITEYEKPKEPPKRAKRVFTCNMCCSVLIYFKLIDFFKLQP